MNWSVSGQIFNGVQSSATSFWGLAKTASSLNQRMKMGDRLRFSSFVAGHEELD